MPILSEEQRADFNQLELVMTKEFISQQLIHLIGCLDTNEEGGRYAPTAKYDQMGCGQSKGFSFLVIVFCRKRVLTVLQEMLGLAQTPSSLVFLLTEKLLSLIPDDQRRIQTVG